MDVAAANLAKLYNVLDRAELEYPQGPSHGSSIEYDNLSRSWTDLLGGLPPIDGYRVVVPLPDIDDIGRHWADYFDFDIPHELYEKLETPRKQVEEYKYRLARARATAIADRLNHLVAAVDTSLRVISGGNSTAESEHYATVENGVAELDRLVGDAIERRGRWSDLRRHLRFGQDHDWDDIATLDWPTVRADVLAALDTTDRPLPIPPVDLGTLASSKPAGGVTTQLAWQSINEEQFERILFEVLSKLPRHQNVQWLTRTNAPDRGRDLSVERLIEDGTGSVRTERVIVQAKHWQSKSVSLSDIANNLAAVDLWQPRVHVLVVATSGRFTTDAVSWVEKRNYEGTQPRVELWPENKLESLLASRPALIATYRLRPIVR